MYIKPFAVEEWMNEYEVGARFNIAETCVDSISPDQLFALAGEDKQAFLADLCAKRLTYGDIVGSESCARVSVSSTKPCSPIRWYPPTARRIWISSPAI